MEGLLVGGIDLHTHSGPGMFPRKLSDFTLAFEAKQKGMRAVVIKAHEESSVSRAKLVQEQVKGIEVVGGIVLNSFAGSKQNDKLNKANWR